jgi:amino acid adenylation domain-containing protein
MGGVLILNGDLNPHLFREAYRYVTNKFDIFRQRFVYQDGELFQTFSSECDVDVSYLDFRSNKNPLEEAMRFAMEENIQPFPFEETRLYQETIIQTAEKQFIWFTRFHHLSNDACGRAVINQAISDTYNSLLIEGHFPEIKSYSYLDFLEDDLRYRESAYYKKSITFWKDKLTPLPEPLSFTIKKNRTKNLSLQTERVTLNLHRMCYASILKIADEADVSLFQSILGILFTTLYKLYGKDDIVIGMPVLNRSNHRFRNTPGHFMNMIPVRVHLKENWTFTDILNSIKSEVKESYRHQRLPLSETVKHFRNNPEFRNELFDVTIIYRKMDFSQRFGEARLHSITLDTQLRTESLSLEIDEYDDEANVNLFFNYNPLVISEEEAVRIAQSFENVLFEAIYSPEKSISQIKILTPFEEHRILKNFNQNGESKRTNHTIISKFAECVNAFPDKVAVVYHQTSLSYSELHIKSNQVANYLAKTGEVSKGDMVCLAANRSAETVITLLGIMKTGAVCLPLDGALPSERVRFILENSGARLLITDNREYRDLTLPVLMLEEAVSCDSSDFSVAINPDDLAYVIYTSGSSGTPKGVMIEHASFMNMFVNMIGNFGVTPTDRVLHFASIGFDAAVFEIFQALLTGAALVIADKETVQDPISFVRYMSDQKVTVATLPPAYLSALDKPELPYLHTLITAGEQANLSDVNHYKKYKKYINGYGPTETSVCSSYFIAEKEIEYKDSMPIGKTVPGSSIYILNEHLEPLPIGFAGELCVSGPILARGYLNNEELTAQKFVPNPFEKGGKMYRTGDKARFRPDGNIEFLGRLDEQVKIKGNRIELGEIEARLLTGDFAREAVVLDVELNGDRVLAAFIIPNKKIGSSELKEFLRKFLPEYMIPHYFIFPDQIPLTQNGKINKAELRKMVSVAPVSVNPDADEPTDFEAKLIPIFERVLNYSPVGVNDNFFELGGESLKTARLITRIKSELQLEINFKAVFDHPTVRGVATELSRCENHQADEIAPAPRQEYYPLSHAQKRLWILAQDKENAAVYNMPVSLLLDGELQTEELKKAICALVERHETLRTTFAEKEGTPCQKVIDMVDNVVIGQDFSQEKDAESQAESFVNKAVMTPFDLSCEIPFRVHLVKISQSKHLLLINMHHIAGDGASIAILMNELSLLYNSSVSGNQPVLMKPQRVHYKDYCVHELKLIESPKYLKEKEFWLKTLRGPLPVLQLPTDNTRSAIKTYSGQYLFSEIGKTLAEQLKKLGKEQNVSPFMILLSSLNVLLHKYSSGEDIIVGSPVDGRSYSELEDLVGLFINTVALRNSIHGCQSFVQFLQDVKTRSAEAISNSDYPFDHLIQHLDIERDTSRAPLFDVFMQYQTKDATELNLINIQSSFYKVDYSANKFDLIFTFTENNEKIALNIGYNTRLFNATRIERMCGHLLNILSTVLNNPNVFIKDITLPDQTETRLIRKMSQGPDVRLDAKTVVDIFEEQVKKTPDQIALVFNDNKLSYSELNQKSNAVANEILKNCEILRDDIIGIMATHSDLMVVGILGILKSGAAYLPISPDLPSERVKFMLSDSRCKLVLTEGNLAERFLQFSENYTIVIDIECIKEPNWDHSGIDTSGQDLAYVIYTSGSTGTPKGVMIEHHSLRNLVAGLSNAIYQNPSTPLNIALISPFYFDASVKQIFYALMNGLCLDVVPDEIRMNGRKLLEYYEKHQINVSDGTPVHLEIVLEELSPDVKRYLPQRFVIGGQQLMRQSIRKLFSLSGDPKLVITNVYGPTECCDVSTCLNITRDTVPQDEMAFSAIPVGKPLDNVQVYILDENLALAPAGINGELCIAGEGLARGYLNNTELTIDKFVKVDFVPDKRIYKTGDIGRYLDDGTILLTGRADDQVKLRGFRIELNEIENCVRNFETISAATVILTGEENREEITAYYTTSEQTEPEDLRHFLTLCLPDYMVPAYFIELESLPVTPNGKVDKKSLPAPLKEASCLDDVGVVTDPLEAKLCGIWQDLLNLDRVSPNDNFFKIGGHSLIAIRLISRIHKEFNIEINIWEVFKYSTVASLAKLLKDKNPSLFCPIEKAETKEFYPLSHAQRRLWVLSRLEGQNTLYNLPAALILKGDLDVEAFECAFQSIVQRHESLRTTFVEIDGEPFQKIADQFDFTIEQADESENSWDHEKINELAIEYSQHEFDLSRLPLMKIRLIRLSGKKYLFLFNMHHIIGDGWSLDIMLKELITFYNDSVNRLITDIQPLPIQYKEYAIWQNKILKEGSLEGIRDYWHRKLSKPRPLINLPTDYKRSDIYSLDGNLLHFPLGCERTNALTELGGSQNSSLFMVLLSAVYILLHKYTGEEDLMVGSPVAGRPHYDLENQIGFFINTLVLRNTVNSENSFQELLGKVNKTLTEAFDNQIYPFDKLVDELEVERLRNRNPLFDVMVAWMVKNGMEMRLTFNGIEVEGLEFSITKSMFDLTFLFEESEGEVILSIEYNTSLFGRDRIERMSEHFKQLVDNVLACPKEKIRDLSILPPQEKEILLCEFNNKSNSQLPQKNVIQWFSNQIKDHQNDTALVFGDQKVTYSALETLSNRIANLLIETIHPAKEDIVTVILENPVLAVAAILGVMKTGAAYLPVMPGTPAERISYIIRDSRSKAVLVDGYTPESKTGDEIYLDIRSGLCENSSLPEIKTEPGDLAYVIYTSGSTGTPKGVMIEHESLSNLIASLNQNIYSHCSPGMNELMVSSFAFDVSLKQIFATLCHGNSLHLLPPEKRSDPREIMNYIIDNKINIVDLTPSVFSVMLEEGFGEMAKPNLKKLFLGSEALPYKLVRNFYKNPDNQAIQVTNFYGPTECCVESSSFRFDPNLMNEDLDIAPIGKPAFNQQIYILDPYLNLCPVGVPGEICIAGKGLARQYLNDQEKTDEKFVPFPMPDKTRIYKTGDSGRVRADGNIEFLGRIDEQVKIRGYRVELQEIEKHMRDVNGINECAVTLFEKDGTSQLAAYFTSNYAIDDTHLRNHLERFLPEYMVPSWFIQLDQIPLSANGKVDKKHLPDPSGLRKRKTFRKPADETESLIVQVCSEILKREEISLDDNFFEIGGNSLNAVRIISRIQKMLNISLALKDIFYHPVLLEISEAVKRAMNVPVTEEQMVETQSVIAPASEEELKLLLELQFGEDE